MKVLKDIISNEGLGTVSSDADSAEPPDILVERASLKLMCIVTAFELLTGQGASLVISNPIYVTRVDCYLNIRRST